MPTPIYVVTGFLGAGKTSFLNRLLNRYDWQNTKILMIQFEAGEEAFQSRFEHCETISFSKKKLEQQPEQIVNEIAAGINTGKPDEIWIEWNGVTPFSQLQSLLSHLTVRGACKIKKVVHLADAAVFERLLGRTGDALPEQVASCDIAAVRNIGSAQQLKQIKRTLKGLNPGINILEAGEGRELCRELTRRSVSPINLFCLLIALSIALYFLLRPVWDSLQIPMDTIINVFLGIILQAIPFLIIGVLLSSAIQVFLPSGWLERRFPKSLGMGMLVALLGGFCLPVCDCATIPVFRSLVNKGVPLSVAVTFMLAAPIINPVVILSTWYAFGGDSLFVVCRICFGIVASLIIGLTFAFWPPKRSVLSNGTLGRITCNCGCYEDLQAPATLAGRFDRFIRHSQAEFLSVGKYLVVGTFISAVFQTLDKGLFISHGGSSLALSIVVMMIMAFVLSLCSSSDAIVARSFINQLPVGAVFGFLVFGPMMDIKNVIMLSSSFSKRFILRLFCLAFIVCFLVIFLFTNAGGV